MITSEQMMASPSGIDCTFIAFGDAGMKCYTSKAHRDVYFLRQQWLAENGFAPKCWFKFDFEGPDGYTIYAYYTEIVECKDATDRTPGSGWTGRFYDAAIAVQTDLLEKHNIHWYDTHAYNTGYDGDKYIIIDVGRMAGPKIDELNAKAGYPGWEE